MSRLSPSRLMLGGAAGGGKSGGPPPIQRSLSNSRCGASPTKSGSSSNGNSRSRYDHQHIFFSLCPHLANMVLYFKLHEDKDAICNSEEPFLVFHAVNVEPKRRPTPAAEKT